MKGYKGFNSDWTCRDMKYKVGETYEINKSPVLCEEGFHFCKYPLDVFRFYPPLEQRKNEKLDVRKFAKVESLGDIDKGSINSVKCCTNKIKIESEIDYEDIIFDSIKCIKESINDSITQIENKDKYGRGISSNLYDYSKSSTNTESTSISANIGDNSVSLSSNCSTITANTGEYSYSGNDSSSYRTFSSISANTGGHSISLTDDTWSISSTTGIFGVSYSSSSNSISASTGNCSISHVDGIESISANVSRDGISYSKGDDSISATTGCDSISYNTGIRGIAITNGTNGIASVESKSNSSSVSISLGRCGMAKGSLGSWLVLADWDKDDNGKFYMSAVKSFLVDNDKVKENTLYTLENGELKEVKE